MIQDVSPIRRSIFPWKIVIFHSKWWFFNTTRRFGKNRSAAEPIAMLLQRGIPLKQREEKTPVGGVWIQIISLPPWKSNVLAMDLRCWGGPLERLEKKPTKTTPLFGWLAGCWRVGENKFGWLNVLLLLLLEELGLKSFSCGLWLFVCLIFWPEFGKDCLKSPYIGWLYFRYPLSSWFSLFFVDPRDHW